MKRITNTLVVVLLSFFSYGQDISVRIFDKNSGHTYNDVLTQFNEEEMLIIMRDKIYSLSISYDRIRYRYVDIYLDTNVSVACDTCYYFAKYMHENIHSGGYGKGFSQFNRPEYYHGIINTNYLEEEPVTKFKWKDFLSFDDGAFFGALCAYEYGGLASGLIFKYIKDENSLNFMWYGSYSKIWGGRWDGSNAIAIGNRICVYTSGLLGINMNTVFDKEKMVNNIKPSIGTDIGRFSLMYGYNFKLGGRSSLRPHEKHSVEITYCLNITRPFINYKDKYKYD